MTKAIEYHTFPKSVTFPKWLIDWISERKEQRILAGGPTHSFSQEVVFWLTYAKTRVEADTEQ